MTYRRILPVSAAVLALGAATALPAAAGTSASGEGAQAAAAKTAPVKTSRADVDGDGRADTTTLTLASTKNGVHRYLLTSRTATGARASLTIPIEDGGEDINAVWLGLAGVDGARGNEVVVNISPVGDGAPLRVYRWDRGRFSSVPAPGAPRTHKYDWFVSDHPIETHGFTFSTRKGTRYVVKHDLRSKSWTGPYRGTHTTYRWSKGTWSKVSTKSAGVLKQSVGAKYAGLSGLTWS